MRHDMNETTLQPIFRFAPSPNGLLHLGHAYSALFTWQAAQAAGGCFLLRIEDIDVDRARPEFITAIFEDLAWIGLVWEEPVRRQSEHFDVYVAALARLRNMGLVYPCFATRAEITAAGSRMARDPDGAPLYPGLWKGRRQADIDAMLGTGAPYALRLDMARAVAAAEEMNRGPLFFHEGLAGPSGQTGRVRVDAAMWGDAVIARKDVPASYHLAVVVDDALQGVSHVTRGQDLFYATHIHRVLQVLLDLPAPRYRHHALVRDASGRKLSKSAKDTSLRSLRQTGLSAAEVKRRLNL